MLFDLSFGLLVFALMFLYHFFGAEKNERFHHDQKKPEVIDLSQGREDVWNNIGRPDDIGSGDCQQRDFQAERYFCVEEQLQTEGGGIEGCPKNTGVFLSLINDSRLIHVFLLSWFFGHFPSR